MTNTNENAASGCKACDGEGAIHTGIEEFPETWCESCKGTGTVQAPQAATTGQASEVAPWPDFRNQPIRHGARLAHPDGNTFVAVHLRGYDEESDAWRAVYDYDPQHVSRLCLQIGDKGRAVLASPAATTASASFERYECTQCTWAGPSERVIGDGNGPICPECDAPVRSQAPSREAAPMDERALVQARDALNGLLWQFTSTPSTLKDSNARAQGHAAIKAIDAALAQHSAEPAPSAPAAVDALARRIMFAAYSRCLGDDRLTPNQIADTLLSAAQTRQVPAAREQQADRDLCNWLRENSSGAYRKCTDAAARIEELANLAAQPAASRAR